MTESLTVHGTWARSVPACGPGQDLHDVEVAQVGLRRDLDLAVVEQRVLVGVARPARSGSRAGTATRSGPDLKPAVTHLLPPAVWIWPRGCGRYWSSSWLRVADRGHEHAGVAAGVLDCAVDRQRVVGDQRDDRDRRVDLGDLADQAAVADHRDRRSATPSSEPLSTSIVCVPERRVAQRSRGRHRVVGARGPRLLSRPSSASSWRFCSSRSLALGELARQRADLLLQLRRPATWRGTCPRTSRRRLAPARAPCWRPPGPARGPRRPPAARCAAGCSATRRSRR